MNKKFLLLTGIFSVGLLHAQIGINTEMPLGIFHIDGASDNVSGASTVYNNDVIFSLDNKDKMRMDIGGKNSDTGNVSLYLHNDKKGLVLNNLSLGNTQSTVVAAKRRGMVAYNTDSANDVIANLLYYYGPNNAGVDQWNKIYSTVDEAQINIRDLVGYYTASTSGTYIDDAGATLNFGSPIQLKAGRSYVFSFRLFGKSPTVAAALEVSNYYLKAIVTKSAAYGGGSRLVDTIEMDIMYIPNGASISYTAILNCVAVVGDDYITFRLAHADPSRAIWLVNEAYNGAVNKTPARTSMLYWCTND